MTISKLTDLEFIVLACDGIFDVMNNTEVIKFVRSRLAQRIHPKEVIITKMTVRFQKCLLSRTKNAIFRTKMTVNVDQNQQFIVKMADLCPKWFHEKVEPLLEIKMTGRFSISHTQNRSILKYPQQ